MSSQVKMHHIDETGASGEVGSPPVCYRKLCDVPNDLIPVRFAYPGRTGNPRRRLTDRDRSGLQDLTIDHHLRIERSIEGVEDILDGHPGVSRDGLARLRPAVRA